MALYELQRSCLYQHLRVDGLLTTMTKGYDRISGHGLRRQMLERQADCMAFDLQTAYISQQSTMSEYESVMEQAYASRRGNGTSAIAFGDVQLKGPKKVHSQALTQVQMEGIFPLWQRATRWNAHQVLDVGIKALTICVNADLLDVSFVGQPFDHAFLARLPSTVDCSGENGEFHTFVFSGPMFKRSVGFKLGEVVSRSAHHYCDVLPD